MYGHTTGTQMASFSKINTGWRAQVKVKGKRATKVFPNKVQAQAWARAKEQEMHNISNSGFVSPTGLTIPSLLVRYEKEQGHTWSESKASAVGRLLKDCHLKADELTPTAVREWALQRSYGLGTSRIDLATLQGMLKHAKQVWFIETNYDAVQAARLSLEKGGEMPVVQHRDRRISVDEENAIIRNWQSNRIPAYVVPFLIDTPIRSGEMCGLTRNDIDDYVITIRDRKDPHERGRIDRVPLLGRSYEILHATGTLRPFPFSQEKVNLAITDAVKKAGLEGITAHTCRHEGISRMFEKGYGVPQVALVSGHKNWNTLKRYTHITAESLLSPPS